LKTEGLLNSLKEHFEATLTIRLVRFSTKFDDLAQAVVERIKPRSKSVAEQFGAEQAEHISKLKKKIADVEEHAEKVKFAIGLLSLDAAPQESFKLALGLILQEQKGTMCIKLEGESNETMEGQVMENVHETWQLQAKVPADAPCYYATWVKKDGCNKLLLIAWLPEGGDPKMNVMFSSTRISVLSALYVALKGMDCQLVQAEVHLAAEFKGELNVVPVEVSDVKAPRTRASSAVLAGDLMAAMASRGTTGSKRQNKPKIRRSTYKANKEAAAQVQQAVAAAAASAAP